MDIPFSTDSINILSNTVYVIIMKDSNGRLTLLADPGLNQPWSSKNKRLADFHARECDGEARTWKEAFALLLKENPGFEKELTERIAKRAQDFTKTVLDKNNKFNTKNPDQNNEIVT